MLTNKNNTTDKIFKHAYTGSFDPWTKGHQSVVESFLKKDPDANIEIIIGKNPHKKDRFLNEPDRAFVIKQGISPEFLPRVKVTIYEGVIADYMYEHNIPYFIRGVRDEKDFREEVDLANLNSQLFGAPITLLIPQVEANLSDVSSSNFKLLGNLGIPMDRYANAYTRELLKIKTTGKLLIGVTGGIASGKSTFCKQLVEFSKNELIPIQSINMDALGHVVLESKRPCPLYQKCRDQIAELFGTDVIEPDGAVNRQKLGKMVFGNDQKLDQLTNLLSEPIMYLLAKKIRSAKKGIILVESAILIDRNITELVDDNIIHVYTDKQTQIDRMIEARNLTDNQAIKRINSQLSAEELKERIDALHKEEFDRLYLPIDTSKALSQECISYYYKILFNEYNRRKQARRSKNIFIPSNILVKDEGLFFEIIENIYSNNNRAYHNIKHISESLCLFQQYQHLFLNPKEIYLAILLHDAIYDISKKDNEHQSALLAEEFIAKHIENKDINIGLVMQFIELTAYHVKDLPQIDEETKIFLDIDRAILAAPKKRLVEYEAGVKAEYSKLYPIEEYIEGRLKFLNAMAQKDIFLSQQFRDRYEKNAKDNVQFLLTFITNE